MAIAALPRIDRRGRQDALGRQPATPPWRRIRVLALVLVGLLLLALPTGLAVGEVLAQNAHDTVLHLQADLQNALLAGVDPQEVRPLQDRLATIAPAGWEDPIRAQRQLDELRQLHTELSALFARSLRADRDAFLRTYRQWEELSGKAVAAGLSLEGLGDPVGKLRAVADMATTPAGFRGLAGVLTTYSTALDDRLTAYLAARTATDALLTQARATLQSATPFRELKLATFQVQLAAAAADLADVHLPSSFAPIQDRLRQTEAAIKTLLTARQAAYAELAAARAAVSSARAAGVDVLSHAARIEALAVQLAGAGDDPTLNRIRAELAVERQALNGLLVVTIPAPAFQQAMPLDCETSALRIALAYFGHHFTDAQLFAGEPVDLRAPVMGPNRTILQWGNPYTHFVGNVNGVAAIPTGYGVYYPVIVNLARSHGLPNTVGGEGYAASTIYAELRARHPVEVWVEYNWARYQMGTWMAWDGTKVRYSFGEHAVTLTGVSPTEVRVNDPAHGTQYWVSKATFEASWRDFNNMAVVFK